MKLSIIMPAFNEGKTIGQAIKRILAVKEVSELIIVDDGSTDDTRKKIGLIKDRRITLIRVLKNKGKGNAVKLGLVKVKNNFVLIHDADLEYDPADIASLIKPVREGKAEVVYGSRFTGPHKNMFFWHMLGNKFLSFLVNLLFNTTLSDMETCYKLLPTKLLREIKLEATDFAIEPEITCKVLKRGYYIYEVPISYNGRTFAEGKKITWKDGLKALACIIKYRLI